MNDNPHMTGWRLNFAEQFRQFVESAYPCEQVEAFWLNPADRAGSHEDILHGKFYARVTFRNGAVYAYQKTPTRWELPFFEMHPDRAAFEMSREMIKGIDDTTLTYGKDYAW